MKDTTYKSTEREKHMTGELGERKLNHKYGKDRKKTFDSPGIRGIITILATNHSLACGMYKVGPLRRYRVTFCVAGSRLYTTRTSLASSEIAGCVWMSSWMSGFRKKTHGL